MHNNIREIKQYVSVSPEVTTTDKNNQSIFPLDVYFSDKRNCIYAIIP